MLIKIANNYSSLISNKNSITFFKSICSCCYLPSITNLHIHYHHQHCCRHRRPSLLLPQRQTHDWRRPMKYNNERRKVIPNLVYLHNPWKYLMAKLNLLKVQLLWDHELIEREFIRGAKKAAVVLSDTIRTQNTSKIGKLTTPIGFHQITRDMLLSRKDTRLKLVRFETEHLRRAIPMRVVTKFKYGRKYCFIDILFVAMRNTKDFDSLEETVEVRKILNSLDDDMNISFDSSSTIHRIVYAEIFMRFRRDYTEKDDDEKRLAERDWAVGFYKILSFDILNYAQKEW